MERVQWRQLAPVIEGRQGIVRRDELVAAGASPRQVDRWLADGRLVGRQRGTYRIAGAPPTFLAEVQAALALVEGEAWASHHTAARIWAIAVHGRDPRIELTRPVALSARRPGVIVHRSTYIPDHHVTTRHGIPVTTVPRTVFDLARTTGDRRFDRLVEATLRARLCSVGALHQVLAELGGRGRPGTRRMRMALETRDHGYVPSASELEAVAMAVLHDVDAIRWQVPMADERGFIGVVDGVVDGADVVLELDGERFHSGRRAEDHDAERDERLLRLGLVVRRLTWFDLTRRPDVVRTEILRLVERSRP